jgi:hypothetical protein
MQLLGHPSGTEYPKQQEHMLGIKQGTRQNAQYIEGRGRSFYAVLKNTPECQSDRWVAQTRVSVCQNGRLRKQQRSKDQLIYFIRNILNRHVS